MIFASLKVHVYLIQNVSRHVTYMVVAARSIAFVVEAFHLNTMADT